jgi:uncharacterized protein (TIGR02266 family)
VLRTPLSVERKPTDHADPHFLGYARNVSESGIFLQCPLPPPVGTHMQLLLGVPGQPDRLCASRSEVVWVREHRAEQSLPAGMGVRLQGMDASVEQAWSDWCRHLTAAD